MDDVLSGPELERCFLRAPRRGLAPLRNAMRGVPPEEAWSRLALPESFLATQGRRWFQTGANVERGDRVRDVRQERLRPVARHPRSTLEVCLVGVAAEAMLRAEHAALTFARAYDLVLGEAVWDREVVWAFSSRGQGVSHRPFAPSIPGLEDVFRDVPRVQVPGLVGALPWVYRTVEWAAAWAEWRGSRYPDVDLVRSLQEIYHLGFGVLAVNEGVVTLQHAPRSGAPTRSRHVRKGLGMQLTRAVRSRRVESLQRLLASGADPNAAALLQVIGEASPRGWVASTPEVLRSFVVEAVRTLIASGYDVRRDGATGLYRRARAGEVGPEAMVEGGLAPDTADRDGRTALHEAARVGPMPALEALLTVGCDPNRADLLGWTPLHVAAAAGSQERVDRLLRAGARATRRTVTHRLPGDLGEVEGIPRSMPSPPRPSKPVEIFAGDDWSVFADWLLERGDRRGEALQLETAGEALACEEVLDACRVEWLPELAAVHPLMEAALHDRRLQFSWRCGFIIRVLVHVVDPAWTEMCAALVASPAGQRVESVTVRRGAAIPWQAPRLRELVVRDVERGDTFDLKGCPELLRVVLRGGVEDVCLDAPSIRSLVAERPFLRNDAMGTVFQTLHAPRLASLDLTWHRAPNAAEITDLVQLLSRVPELRSLSLRPASLDVVQRVLEQPRTWTKLSLASLRPDVVRWLLAEPERLANAGSLELRVLDLDARQRKILSNEWAVLRSNVVVKGASYRGAGGY